MVKKYENIIRLTNLLTALTIVAIKNYIKPLINEFLKLHITGAVFRNFDDFN